MTPADDLPETLLDSLAEGCQVIGFDGTYRYLNHAAARQGRRIKPELLGRLMAEVYPGIEQTEMYLTLQRSLQERVTLRMENEFVYPDGATGWFELRFEPVPEGVCILSVDITDRKEDAQRLRKLTTAMDQTAEAVIITNELGAIQYVNPAFETNTGYSASEVLAQDARMITSEKEGAAVYAEVRARLSLGESWRGQLPIRRKDGTVSLQKATLSPVLDGRGNVVSYVGVGRDITLEARLESDVRQSQKMETIGRLAGGIAHDFNNLLSVIIAYADVIVEDLPPDTPLLEDVKRIREAGERAAALTGQLLAFSRKQILQPHLLNLNTVAEGMGDMLRRLIGEHIEFLTVLAPELGHVRADPVQLEQVILNLAVNARDAMPDGGRLTLRTANVDLDELYAQQHVSVIPGRYVMLAVSDSGVGMDEGTRDRAFEPFFTTKMGGSGTGLGLATVYGIVKQSGGNIWVYSEPGRGTTFKIYLPLSEEGSVPRPRGAEPLHRRGAGETILVVEDSPAVRTIAQRILTGDGYAVRIAEDGAAALAVSESLGGRIDLLLTDVVMPQMNGSELARRLTQLNPGLRVLFMSGYTDDAIVHHGVLDARTHFIGKPFDSAALRRKVREVLDG